MGTAKGPARRALLLASILFTVTACVNADTTRKQFDVPGQPAVAALNDFARQADITLFFPYDLVADVQTHPLKGRYTVPDGLTHLLTGTGLDHRQARDGTYFICSRSSCGPLPSPPEKDSEGRSPASSRGDGGKQQQARLTAMPATALES